MDDLAVIEAAHHMDDGVHLPDMGKELVAQPLALRSALDEPRNIHEFNDRRGHLIGGIHFAQFIQPGVRHRHHAHVRFYGAEGIVCRTGFAAGQRIKNSTLSNIWKSYDTELHIDHSPLGCFSRRSAGSA